MQGVPCTESFFCYLSIIWGFSIKISAIIAIKATKIYSDMSPFLCFPFRTCTLCRLKGDNCMPSNVTNLLTTTPLFFEVLHSLGAPIIFGVQSFSFGLFSYFIPIKSHLWRTNYIHFVRLWLTMNFGFGSSATYITRFTVDGKPVYGKPAYRVI